MQQLLDVESSALEVELVFHSSNQMQTIQAAKESIFFDTCLVLSVIFCVLELAVQLLRAQTFLQVLALILSVTIWAVSAVSIEFVELSGSRRFHVLFTAGLLSNLLLLGSLPTSTSLAFGMYAVDCLMKCALVLLLLQASAAASPNITDKGGERTIPVSPTHH